MIKYILLLCFLTQSCVSDKYIYEDKIDFKNNTWKYNEILMFNFKIQNIDTKYDVNVNITHTDYNYRNIIFFTYLYNDSLLIQKDTINIDIYNKYGKTKGKGMSGVKKISSNIYKNHLFKNIGFYSIHIEQAFRVGQKNRIDSLGSLYSFGLEVINNKDED